MPAAWRTESPILPPFAPCPVLMLLCNHPAFPKPRLLGQRSPPSTLTRIVLRASVHDHLPTQYMTCYPNQCMNTLHLRPFVCTPNNQVLLSLCPTTVRCYQAVSNGDHWQRAAGSAGQASRGKCRLQRCCWQATEHTVHHVAEKRGGDAGERARAPDIRRWHGTARRASRCQLYMRGARELPSDAASPGG